MIYIHLQFTGSDDNILDSMFATIMHLAAAWPIFLCQRLSQSTRILVEKQKDDIVDNKYEFELKFAFLYMQRNNVGSKLSQGVNQGIGWGGVKNHYVVNFWQLLKMNAMVWSCICKLKLAMQETEAAFNDADPIYCMYKQS